MVYAVTKKGEACGFAIQERWEAETSGINYWMYIYNLLGLSMKINGIKMKARK